MEQPRSQEERGYEKEAGHGKKESYGCNYMLVGWG